jgi:hypothetical protein
VGSLIVEDIEVGESSKKVQVSGKEFLADGRSHTEQSTFNMEIDEANPNASSPALQHGKHPDGEFYSQ